MWRMLLQLKQKLDNAVNLCVDNDDLSQLAVTCWVQTFLFALYSICYTQNCLQVLYSEPDPQNKHLGAKENPAYAKSSCLAKQLRETLWPHIEMVKLAQMKVRFLLWFIKYLLCHHKLVLIYLVWRHLWQVVPDLWPSWDGYRWKINKSSPP